MQFDIFFYEERTYYLQDYILKGFHLLVQLLQLLIIAALGLIFYITVVHDWMGWGWCWRLRLCRFVLEKCKQSLFLGAKRTNYAPELCPVHG